MYGFYAWGWGQGSSGPSQANVSIAFTGYAGVADAISNYDTNWTWCCPELEDPKLLTIGGGNELGNITPSVLEEASRDHSLRAIKHAGYVGIVYDVEHVIGSFSEMDPLFRNAFAKAKEAGLVTVITTSHSGPYQTYTPEDARDLVLSWVSDPNVDVISPQLYSSGYET